MKPKKQSSPRLSSLAARVMRELDDKPAGKWLSYDDGIIPFSVLTVGELRSLCASVLTQDEVKGTRKRRVRK